MKGKAKGKSQRTYMEITGDAPADAALSQLAAVLAEIATSPGALAGASGVSTSEHTGTVDSEGEVGEAQGQSPAPDRIPDGSGSTDRR
jgi:hypothetical protein